MILYLESSPRFFANLFLERVKVDSADLISSRSVRGEGVFGYLYSGAKVWKKIC